MGILDRLEQSEPLAVTWSPIDDRWYADRIAPPTFAGFNVSPDTALRVSAVFACNSLIAETLASMPCVLYQRLANGGKEKARTHRWYHALRHRPNNWQTPMNFFGDGQMHAGMRGNALAEILDDGVRGELRPLHPDYVKVEQLDTGRLRYELRDPTGGAPRPISQDRMLHVRDLSMAGIVGQARAALAREAIAVSAAGEAFVAGFFKNDATGRLAVEIPGNPDEKKRAEYRAEFSSQNAGWANARKTTLLWGGMKATELGQHGDSAFLVDPRRFQVADIARFWRVPLFMIGLEEKSTTWGTGIEQQKQGFVDFTIKPWLDRWAQALTTALLEEDEQEEFFIEFLMADLVRGDLLTRMQAYQIGRAIGVWSPNEIRIKENEGPRPGGDEYQDTPAGAPPNPGPRRLGDEPEARAIPAPLIADAVGRLVGAEVGAVKRRAAKAAGDASKWGAWVAAYYEDHRVRVREVLAPLAAAYTLDPAILEEIAGRIEGTAIAALADSVPAGWLERRRDEVLMIVDETLIAGAAVRRAA